MKEKEYEKPILEIIDFDVEESLATGDDEDPELGVESGRDF